MSGGIWEIIKGIAGGKGSVFATTTELVQYVLVDVHGFDEPIMIEMKGIKDLQTGFYRGFEIDVKAPKAMKARFRRVDPKKLPKIEAADLAPKKIITPKWVGGESTEGTKTGIMY